MYIAVAIPVIIAFVISVALGPVIIPFLRKLKFGQTVRDDGPQSHLKKNGTPTMGGIIFLISVILTSCIYLKDYPQIIPVLFVTVGFGVIGFLDDYIKIVLKRSEGLTPSQKMFGQIIVTGVFAVYMYKFSGISMEMIVPFFPNVTLDLGFLTIPVMFLAIIGTVNGVNFTDGLDGLATSVTIMVAVFFGVVALGVASGVWPIACAVIGALLGFLLFNVHPASVFMGDTGSLALGGFVASIAYMLQMPIFILIVGLIYWIEILSVIIQVGYFKISHGKRIFRMAPIHH
ncbi:MAG: phospho-N-acetylmuramoyl-pentapeptide-transferase, partial [Lachnospiraceae bacterium]|nr:phospho-N-acetylmuramoyl-pentapeptide-transferase [Lachnospiraceae bacterium]